MSSDDESAFPPVNTSDILSDPDYLLTLNGLLDDVAAESIEAGRVGTKKDDPKFEEAKVYADAQVPGRLPEAIAIAETEALARRGHTAEGQANNQGAHSDDQGAYGDEQGMSAAAAVPGTATQGTAAGSEEQIHAVEPEIQMPHGESHQHRHNMLTFSNTGETSTPKATEPFSIGGKRLPTSMSATGGEHLDASDASTISAISEGSELLEDYKTYILSKLGISDENRDRLQRLLDQHGWSTVWQALDKIKGYENGLNWTWSGADEQLLSRLVETGFMEWTDIAEYIFIGMRISQCRAHYGELTEEEE